MLTPVLSAGQLATRLGANQDTSLPFAGSNVPEVVELLDVSGAVTQRLRLITNQVGTVQAAVDATTGELVQRLEHDEFGRVLYDSSSGLQPFGFAGGLMDADTGLVRFGARDYEPNVGRWIARDPVRFGGGLNKNDYSYAQSNPTEFVDSAGLDLRLEGNACYLACARVFSTAPWWIGFGACLSLCGSISEDDEAGSCPSGHEGASGQACDDDAGDDADAGSSSDAEGSTCGQ